MTYLEMDIICSRFLLFLKYSPHPMIFFLLTRYEETTYDVMSILGMG